MYNSFTNHTWCTCLVLSPTKVYLPNYLSNIIYHPTSTNLPYFLTAYQTVLVHMYINCILLNNVHISYLPSYLPTYLPFYLPTYLHPLYQLTYLTTFFTCIPNHLTFYLPFYLSTYLSTYLPNFLPLFLQTYLFTYLPITLIFLHSYQATNYILHTYGHVTLV